MPTPVTGSRALKFVLDAGGAVTYLGLDVSGGSPNTPLISSWAPRAEGVFQRLDVDATYIVAAGTDDGAIARTQIAAYLESVRTSMRWKPPVLKELARGAAYIPNLFANKGSVRRVNDDVAVLPDCFLEEVKLTDDADGINAVGLRFTFVAVAPRAAP